MSTKGRLGILATCRALYRANAEEGFNMVDHISKLKQLQDKLHTLGSRDYHGFQKLRGLRVGYAGVRVRVALF